MFPNSANRFSAMGIPTDTPGFYDHPRFIEAEQGDPTLLEEYAAFVTQQQYSREYLNHAENIIQRAITFLHEKLRAERQTGKCIDGSMVLLRFLEQQGIWGYAVNGALSIEFESGTKISPARFAPIMLANNPAMAGHVWFCAPPFQIVDATISLQPYRGKEASHLPEVVAAHEVNPSIFDARDLMEPEAVEKFTALHRRTPTVQDIERMDPGILARIQRFGSVEILHGQTKIRYVAVAISAPLEPLDQWRNLILGGKTPVELYEDFKNYLASTA